MQTKHLTKSTLASAGLTAAGASLLSTEYLKDTRAELGDGSERPLRETSGMHSTQFTVKVCILIHRHPYGGFNLFIVSTLNAQYCLPP